MSAPVTSITDLRARAQQRDRISLAKSRLVVFVLVLVGLLLVVGLGATMSASSVEGILGQSDRLAVFKRQLRWVLVGILTLIITIRVPYAWYRRAAVPILAFSTLVLALVPVVGATRGGAQRWIEVGLITVQPSEFAKLAVIVFLAKALADRPDRVDDLREILGPLLLSLGVTCGLVVVQPDLGTALIIGGAGAMLVLASGTPLRYVLGGVALAAGLAALFTIAYEYRRERFACFLDPLADPLGSCFQLAQSLMALGSGNLMGVGLGASRARWAFLPNAHTDFIFTIIAEETGFIGAVGLILALVGLSLAGIWIAYQTADPFRPPGGGRHHRLAERAVPGQRRRCRRGDSGHRSGAPLRVGGRQRDGGRDGGGRDPGEHRPYRPLPRRGGRAGFWLMSYAIAAAGTGGHIYPGLAVAEQLVSAGVPHSRVVFLGGDRMEAEIIPREGFPFVRLELQGLARSLSTRNLRLPMVVWRAVRRAAREIDARRVASVLCMGGYVTVPVAIAARRTGRPLYLHEQNMHAGLANRVAARWADRAFVSFSGTRGIDGAVIGYPLRAGLDRPDGGRARPEALARYGFEDDRPVVGVVGGSLGARTLNEAVTAMSAAWGGGPYTSSIWPARRSAIGFRWAPIIHRSTGWCWDSRIVWTSSTRRRIW